MSLNAEICRLLERAKPLRRLPADEAEDAGLGKLVEQINALRKIEADAERDASLASIKAALTPDELYDNTPEAVALRAQIAAQPRPLPTRRPGRPRKAD